MRLKIIVFIIIALVNIIQAQEWSEINTTFHPNASFSMFNGAFINNDLGYSVNDYLYKTNDGGISWYKIEDLSDNWGFGVEFFNPNLGFYWTNSELYKTEDSGENWIATDFPNLPITTIFFLNNEVGIAGSTLFYYTSDGGNSWNEAEMPYKDSVSVNDIQLLENGTGWAFAQLQWGLQRGVCLKTTDFGKTWETVLITEQQLSCGYFIDENHGVAADYWYENSFYYTEDSGKNWSKTNYPQFFFVSDIYLLNDTLGWAVGEDHIVKTEDGGLSWEIAKRIEFYAFNFLNHISFTEDKKLGYIFGSDNKLLLYDNSITSVEQQNLSIPTEYSLSQNYPNPFNPSTTIEYSIPVVDVPSLPVRQTGGVEGPNLTLRIYDTLGREIATLVNEAQAPGSYSVKWDASNYSSGLYIYQLSHGTKQITNKMLLVK